MKNIKRVVIYARVSTAEQAEEGYSIEAQINNITDICTRENSQIGNKEIVGQYIDRGISGKEMTKRLALQELMRDAKKGKFDEVWVWKTNRLARNQIDLLGIVEDLEKHNVGVRSCTEPFDTSTPAGRLLLGMLASIGQFERETIVENVKMGMKQRAKQGSWNGGIVLGYESVLIGDGTDKTTLKIVEEEALIVKRIFNLYAEGLGYKAIVQKINLEGYKTKKGNLFSTVAIREILKNPIYIGKIRYNVRENWSQKRRAGYNENPIIVKGEHKPIINEELWNRVQVLLASKSKKPARLSDGSFLLSGILKCPVCGAGMVAGKSSYKNKSGEVKEQRYYFCGAWKSKGSAACKSNGVRADYAEEYVVERIKEVVSHQYILRDIVNKVNDRSKVDNKPLIQEEKILKKELGKIENRKEKVFELFEEGMILKTGFRERMSKIEQDEKQLADRYKEIEQKLNKDDSRPIEYKKVKDIMERFAKLLLTTKGVERKNLVQLLLKEIHIDENRSIDSICIEFNEEVAKILNGKGVIKGNINLITPFFIKI